MRNQVPPSGTAGHADDLRSEEVVAAVVVPPLRRFLDRCRVTADEGDFVSGLALLDLVLKGAASPLSTFEARFWKPVDPFLASLIRAAGEDDRQHVCQAAEAVRSLIADDPARRMQLATHCQEARASLAEAFRYYARKLVGLFAAVQRNYPERYAGVEIADSVAMMRGGRLLFCDALDRIKETHQRVTLRFEEPRSSPPCLEAAFAWAGGGREWTALYHGAAVQLEAAAAAVGARIVAQAAPSLDEIFVARTRAPRVAMAEG